MSEATRDRLLDACYAFMRNVALFLLRAGISYREFQEISKRAFVTVATEEFGIRGRPTNASRVAAMTGLSRKEVRAVQDGVATVKPVDMRGFNPTLDVLHAWYDDDRFSVNDNGPRSLSFGESGEFDMLVAEYGGDIPPGAIRHELLRMGAVTQQGKMLFPVSPNFVLPNNHERRLFTICEELVHMTEEIGVAPQPENLTLKVDGDLD